jgi:hypothetical protein
MQEPSSRLCRPVHECHEQGWTRTCHPRLSEELRRAVLGRRSGYGERRDQEPVSRSLRTTAIETTQRTGCAHVKGRGKQSDSVITTVVMFGSLIHIHTVVIERENDGMLSLRFVKRQARDKDMGIGKHGQMGVAVVVVVVVPASCTLQRMPLGTAYVGKVTHGNSREVVVRRMAPRCICACMHRVVGWEGPPSFAAILNKVAGW